MRQLKLFTFVGLFQGINSSFKQQGARLALAPWWVWMWTWDSTGAASIDLESPPAPPDPPTSNNHKFLNNEPTLLLCNEGRLMKVYGRRNEALRRRCFADSFLSRSIVVPSAVGGWRGSAGGTVSRCLPRVALPLSHSFDCLWAGGWQLSGGLISSDDKAKIVSLAGQRRSKRRRRCG